MSDAIVLGILTTLQLTSSGWTKWQIERALGTGALVRVRPGWFHDGSPDPAALVAVRAGGCISCFSALRLHGVWTPEGKGNHFRLPRHRRKRKGSRACHPFGERLAVSSAVDSLAVAFRCVLRCGSREDIVVVIDSILHRQLAERETVLEWMAEAPARVRSLLAAADGRSESGTESMVRFRLRALQLAVRIQVRVMQGARVDLLVGERLVIECDSREHHTDAAAYEKDRRRDRELVARGFIVLRVSYRQIHDEWAEIERAILAVVRRGDHRWPRTRKIRT
ncbi:endonuclease domain-containing protein [Agrococcus baldri]|uniref:DUF559 domain-containing protein n=1 Tax=Agrococcus baldri TaxID=153730 RepID=A0AA87RIC9_9MICO|nr:DUF559 domain-containing protein [Agrococcus baldri]GEK79908.1 hypothetical protein ABA31_12590 [Agrococcus baldri]